MASENGKKDELVVRAEQSDAELAVGATPKPASELDEGAEASTEEKPEQSPLAKLAARFTKPAEPSRDAKSGERTRGLVILAGTAIACLFLFFGLFTTDGGANRKERQTKPSLGRPEAAAVNPETANRSPVPQLSVNQQPNEDSSELTEKDLLGTMRNRGTTVPTASVPTATLPPSPLKQTLNPARALDTVNFDDPALAEAYRRQGLKPPPPRTEVTDWNAAIADYQAKQKPAAPPVAVANPSELLRKSSIVFVRTAIEKGNAQGAPTPALERKRTGLLPPGTALVARLQHGVSSAAKSPVVAVIEYNYEEGGRLIVPAGAKAYGELSQATPQGWVGIKFHTLEFPGGSQEKIDGSAVSMERGVLRGDVNGKGGAKKFLTRTLTGVGTIAAYAVGGRGLNAGIDNSVLLRERLSSNIALAGEQELATLAYQQNIVVTVPANTRFLLVLHEAGVSWAVATPQEAIRQPPSQKSGSEILQQTSTRGSLSELELREMVQLRNEMREMNRLMQNSLPKPDQPPFDEK
jgi:hypothetical protein